MNKNHNKIQKDHKNSRNAEEDQKTKPQSKRDVFQHRLNIKKLFDDFVLRNLDIISDIKVIEQLKINVDKEVDQLCQITQNTKKSYKRLNKTDKGIFIGKNKIDNNISQRKIIQCLQSIKFEGEIERLWNLAGSIRFNAEGFSKDLECIQKTNQEITNPFIPFINHIPDSVERIYKDLYDDKEPSSTDIVYTLKGIHQTFLKTPLIKTSLSLLEEQDQEIAKKIEEGYIKIDCLKRSLEGVHSIFCSLGLTEFTRVSQNFSESICQMR